MAIKISSKFQVVIPLKIRESLGLSAGQEIEVVAKGKIAYLIPVPTLKSLQRSLSKINSQEEQGYPLRDKKHRL